jgi:hypothetical protein
VTAAASVPPRPTAKVSIVSDSFSVTTTCLTSGLMATSSGPLAVTLRNGRQAAAGRQEARHIRRAAGVQDLDEAAVDRDTGRLGASAGDHTPQPEGAAGQDSEV